MSRRVCSLTRDRKSPESVSRDMKICLSSAVCFWRSVSSDSAVTSTSSGMISWPLWTAETSAAPLRCPGRDGDSAREPFEKTDACDSTDARRSTPGGSLRDDIDASDELRECVGVVLADPCGDGIHSAAAAAAMSTWSAPGRDRNTALTQAFRVCSSGALHSIDVSDAASYTSKRRGWVRDVLTITSLRLIDARQMPFFSFDPR
mmetsp:Transcript_31206/g.93623  ORF Transcript_31206/g.93623 Transcript_31206/m.93623 type:complete len:204 (+) Transcript_31206:2624-3235(+)